MAWPCIVEHPVVYSRTAAPKPFKPILIALVINYPYLIGEAANISFNGRAIKALPPPHSSLMAVGNLAVGKK